MPAYGLPEAARYLRMAPATLRSWILGRYYPTSAGERFFQPVIHLPEPEWPVRRTSSRRSDSNTISPSRRCAARWPCWSASSALGIRSPTISSRRMASIIRLYPFTRKRELDEPRAVVIDPFVSFGRPVLAGTGISTAVVAERFKAGEPMGALADDYGRSLLEIEEAIRCELPLEAA